MLIPWDLICTAFRWENIGLDCSFPFPFVMEWTHSELSDEKDVSQEKLLEENSNKSIEYPSP